MLHICTIFSYYYDIISGKSNLRKKTFILASQFEGIANHGREGIKAGVGSNCSKLHPLPLCVQEN